MKRFTFYYQAFNKKGGRITSHGVGETFPTAMQATEGLVKLNQFHANRGKYSRGIILEPTEALDLWESTGKHLKR